MCTRQSLLTGSERLNRVRGMIIGLALGDSLGLPIEFKHFNQKYTGKLFSFNVGSRTVALGEISDDSEMTLALARSLIENKGYNRNSVIMAYINWANSKPRDIGINISNLFQNRKSIEEYNEWYNIIVESSGGTMQSNGSLMRCSPLSLLYDEKSIEEDCRLTNPSSVNVEVELLYIRMMKLALDGKTKKDVLHFLYTTPKSTKITNVVNHAKENKVFPSVSGKSRGWVLSSFYCALVILIHFDNFEKAMKYIIDIPDSDTDTNAAIAGALYGCIIGFDELLKYPITNDNINKIINSNSDRPSVYKLNDFYELTEKLNQLR
jgi:ADP-ribosyl-[dinitrogen reductase] hydrolase